MITNLNVDEMLSIINGMVISIKYGVLSFGETS